jgi:hypothetical protein
MRSLIGFGAALALAGMAAPVAAQLRVIEAAEATAWRHAGTGTGFPATVGTLRRTAIRDTGAKELDVIIGYKSPDEADEVTFYLFKTQIVSAPLWFDRALDAVMLRPGLVAGTARPEPRTFEAQPGRGSTGLRASLPITFGKYRASGIAVIPVGPWLLKVRLSSENPDLVRLDALLSAAINALALPSPAGELAARPVQPCADQLFFAQLQPAKASKETSSQILAASLIGGAPRKPNDYCRDRPGTLQLGVYRPGGAGNAYVAAISDAGRAMVVEPGLKLGQEAAVYSFSALELGKTMVYRPLKALPEPAEALAYILREQPAAFTEFADGKVNTTISSDVLK